MVKLLLETSVDVESKDSEYIRAPLSLAAVYGYSNLVELLLEEGADIESRDLYCQAPLWWSVEKGREAMERLLLEKGAQKIPN